MCVRRRGVAPVDARFDRDGRVAVPLRLGSDDVSRVVVATRHDDGQAGAERRGHLDGPVDGASCGGRAVGAYEYALQHGRRP